MTYQELIESDLVGVSGPIVFEGLGVDADTPVDIEHQVQELGHVGVLRLLQAELRAVLFVATLALLRYRQSQKVSVLWNLTGRIDTYHFAAFTVSIEWAWTAVPQPNCVIAAPCGLLPCLGILGAVWNLVVDQVLGEDDKQ